MFKYYLLCSCLLLIGCQSTKYYTVDPNSSEYSRLLREFYMMPDNSNNPKWIYCKDKTDGYDEKRDAEFVKYINENTVNMKFVGCKDGHAEFTIRNK